LEKFAETRQLQTPSICEITIMRAILFSLMTLAGFASFVTEEEEGAYIEDSEETARVTGKLKLETKTAIKR
jgi:hypothetical protein